MLRKSAPVKVAAIRSFVRGKLTQEKEESLQGMPCAKPQGGKKTKKKEAAG